MSVPVPPAPGLGLYFLAMYVKGPVWSPESTPAVEETQARHLAYNADMAEKGHYKLIGPFHEPFDPRWRGIILMKADSIEQAAEFMRGDPAVQSGRLSFELSALWLAKASLGDE